MVIGDGAEWIWNLVAEHFPEAIQIVDLYHARQHLWEVARQLYPHEEVKQKAWMRVHQKRLLDKGKIEKLVGVLRSIVTANPQMAEKICTEADYFERNAERMRYPKFRRQHLFIGSGVIEAGCKTVIGSRLKQSGMFWTVRGANAILALRCTHLNGRFEEAPVRNKRIFMAGHPGVIARNRPKSVTMFGANGPDFVRIHAMQRNVRAQEDREAGLLHFPRDIPLKMNYLERRLET